MEKEQISYKRELELAKKDLAMVREQNNGLKIENAKHSRQTNETGEIERRLRQETIDLEMKVRDLEDKLKEFQYNNEKMVIFVNFLIKKGWEEIQGL